MPIQILPPILANQIAAGEVVERPASVVKELIENSIDAGATQIDVDVVKGGIQQIRILDNGCGISGDELNLALTRHATSKVSSLDDLEHIASLGFRGEALASISAVSRLTLTTRTVAQPEAWQAYTEGLEMAVTIKPAAHPVGTTVDVLDLFFNTPARRRFLRSEKTEFGHIDELLRRFALSRFDIGLTLKHNGKLMRQYKIARTDTEQLQRITQACGHEFVASALHLQNDHLGLTLHGWVAGQPLTSVGEVQYCYVNGRMIRDKLLMHAIRQAYSEIWPETTIQPAYVLYLTLDPALVDVNVHPTKHEVRFHESRQIHDYLVQVLAETLQAGRERWPVDDSIGSHSVIHQESVQSLSELAASHEVSKPGIQERAARYQPEQDSSGDYPVAPLRPRSGEHHYSSPVANPRRRADTPDVATLAVYQRLLDAPTGESDNITPGLPILQLLQQRFALTSTDQQIYLVDLQAVQYHQWLQYFHTQFQTGLTAQPLLMPVRMTLESAQSTLLASHAIWFQKAGFKFNAIQKQLVIVQVPAFLRQRDLVTQVAALFTVLARFSSDCQESDWLHFLQAWLKLPDVLPTHFSGVQAQELWAWFLATQPDINTCPWVKTISLSDCIKDFSWS